MSKLPTSIATNPTSKIVEWANKNNPDYKRLKLQNNKMTAINGDAHVYGDSILSGYFKFVIKIGEVQSNIFDSSVTIGVSDIANVQKKAPSVNFIRYRKNGFLSANSNKITKISPFKIGDSISVMGCLDDGEIKFKLNQQQVHIFPYEQLKSKNVKWVPYIHLWEGSTVLIIESEPELLCKMIFLVESIFQWDYDLVHGVNELIEISFSV